MTDFDTGILAARLLAVSAAVLLLPGIALLAALRLPTEWPERIVLAFSLSYSWIFILSLVVPVFGWTVDHAAVFTLVLLVASAGLAAARAHGRELVVAASWQGRIVSFLLVAVVITCAVGAWVIEPPITGEEVLDLASLSRFADGGPITFENTSLLPDTRPIYLFQPYQLALGMIARWSTTDPLIAFVKFRAFLAPLCLVFLYALVRRLTSTHTEAGATFIVVLLFIALDIETWESNSLFPVVRRGGASAGVLVPALLLLCIIATRRAQESCDRLLGRVALSVAPVMLVASLSTHPLEMFTLLWFAAAVVLAIFIGLDRSGDRRRALVLMLAFGAALGTYLTVHSRTVSAVAEYERVRRYELHSLLNQLAADPIEAIVGRTTGARDLLSRSIPATTAAIIGIPALGLAVVRVPGAASLLTLGIVPLALLYASPAGYVLLALITSAETVQDVNGYFMLLALLGLALGLVALAQGVLHAAAYRQRGFGRVVAASAAGSVVLWIVWIGGQDAVQWLASRAATRPDLFLLVAVGVACGVLTCAGVRAQPFLSPAPFPLGVVVVTASLAAPLAVPDLSFGGIFAKSDRVTVVSRFKAALSDPSVLDWPSYYDQMRQSVAPPLPVPRGVVDELRRRLPPRQILLAHPRYSCALAALVDAYCINPEFIYGHYFQPAARYHAEYVRASDPEGPQHPFFNSSWSLTQSEEKLLIEYRVSYVLADPAHAEQIDRKLREASVEMIVEVDRDGYRLYRIIAR